MNRATQAATRHCPFAPRALAATLLVATLGGCGGGSGPAVVPGQLLSAPGGAQQAETRVGDTTVYAVAMQTSTISPQVARENGIERRDDLVMLRVSGRRGAGIDIASAPLQVQATATDLRGRAQSLAMEQSVANDLVDYVGMVETAVPDTLRFEIRITTAEGATGTLEVTREIQAR